MDKKLLKETITITIYKQLLEEKISRQLKLSPWVEQQKAALIQVTSKRTNINGIILMIIKMKHFLMKFIEFFPILLSAA